MSYKKYTYISAIAIVISLLTGSIASANTATKGSPASSNQVKSDSGEANQLPLPLNDDVKRMVKFFQTERRDRIIKALSLMDRYLEAFKKIFREEGVPEVLAYLPFIESAYDPIARSNKGARGIWQFMPYTAKQYDIRVDRWVDERVDPEKSCRAAAEYLKKYYKKFGNWTLAIAAYNAGPRRISRAMRRLKTKDFWKIKRSRYIRGQTKRYVPAFIAGVYIAKFPAKYGFFYVKNPMPDYQVVKIPSPTDLSVVAKCAGIDVEAIKKLNPELRRRITPYNYDNYPLRMPPDSVQRFNEKYTLVPEAERIVQMYHTIKRGDTLSQIAQKYGTNVRTLMSVNHLSSARRLRIGSSLIVPLSPVYYAAKPKPRRYSVRSHKIGQKITYRIRPGDSLYKIAYRFKTDIYSVMRWNDISRNEVLHPGRQLTIHYARKIMEDKKNPLRPGSQDFFIYTVRQGDTLYDIANFHNVSLGNLFKINNLKGSRLYPGDKLRIPVPEKKN